MARKSRGSSGPKNLARTPNAAMSQVRGIRRPKASRAAASPRVRPALAGPGYRPPNGGGGGVPKPTTAMASTPRVKSDRPTGSAARTRRIGRPKADFPSKI